MIIIIILLYIRVLYHLPELNVVAVVLGNSVAGSQVEFISKSLALKRRHILGLLLQLSVALSSGSAHRAIRVVRLIYVSFTQTSSEPVSLSWSI